MWREKESVFCKEVDVVKDKDLEDVTLEQPDVLSIIQGLRKLVKTDSVCICFVTKHHYSVLLWFECWFSFSLFLYFFKVEVVIWETSRACYFRSTSLSLTRVLILIKELRFKRWELGRPMTCALMVSSLRLSACFVYDKPAWVLFTQLIVVHFRNE